MVMVELFIQARTSSIMKDISSRAGNKGKGRRFIVMVGVKKEIIRMIGWL